MLARQREAATALMFGVGALFSKSGFTSVESKLTEITQKLHAGIVEALSGNAPAAPADGPPPSQTVAPRHAPPRRPPGQYTGEDVQRDIRSLDVGMTKLTGKLVRNPMGGYSGQRDLTHFDVHGTPTQELLDRVR